MLDKDNLTDYEKLRKAVISYRQEHTLKETSELFGISNTTIIAWTKKYQQTGLLTKAARGGKTHCIVDKEGEAFIIESIVKNNDLTLKEMRQLYLKHFNVLIGISTVDYTLRKNNISVKKKFL